LVLQGSGNGFHGCPHLGSREQGGSGLVATYHKQLFGLSRIAAGQLQGERACPLRVTARIDGLFPRTPRGGPSACQARRDFGAQVLGARSILPPSLAVFSPSMLGNMPGGVYQIGRENPGESKAHHRTNNPALTHCEHLHSTSRPRISGPPPLG
jgi:hypothetical protein